MENKTTFINSLASFFLVCLIFNSCTQGPIDVTSEIEEANKGFMEAFNNGDANALAMKYTSNAKLYPSNSDVIEGHEAIEEFWNGAMNMGLKKILLETVTAESFGNIAIEEGRSTVYVEDDQIVDRGKYIVTWKKEDGQWKLHKDIWNTNNPAIPRAMENDTILIVTSKVKPENFDRLMDFTMNYFHPAFEEYFPEVKAKTRFFRNPNPDKDGYIIVHYFVDPYSIIDTHNVKPVLSKKYDDEEVERLMQEFSEIIVEQTQTLAVQLAW
jgi:uncharacterized protein (TIGR02246 family)